MSEKRSSLVERVEATKVIVAEQTGPIWVGERAESARIRSNVPASLDRPFVGRDQELATIETALQDDGPKVLVLHGEPGVGKSELAFTYARRSLARYPGGCFLVRMSEGLPTDLAAIGRVRGDLATLKDLPLSEQCELSLAHLGQNPTLLIYDDAPNPNAVQPWLPRAGSSCHVLVTSNWERWDWQALTVTRLPKQASRELVRQLGGDQVADRFGSELVRDADGLPVQLCPSTLAVKAHLRRHPDASPDLALASESAGSFGRAWSRLSPDEQLLLKVATLFAINRLPLDLLEQRLVESAGWTSTQATATIDSCMDVHLIEPSPHPHLHQLLARFVADQPRPALLPGLLERHTRYMVEVATAFADSPGDPDLAATLLSFPLTRSSWPTPLQGADPGDPGSDEHEVGSALRELGRFEEALPWSQQAAEEKERGDDAGQVNHEGFGISLHEVGYCHSKQGRYEEALPWFQRAVAEKEQGDVHGRVDHASLGRSLHQVGWCHSQQGRDEEALPWYQRAVAEAEKGDVDGRVNHESLGISLHQVGCCHSQQGRYEKALRWYQRAMAEAGKGDAHHRADHTFLGACLNQIGLCHSQQGKYDEALPWFQRAVEETKLGDVHGRVDHEYLGRSLNLVGWCHSQQGQYEEALPWIQQSVTEKEQGDVHGRVDHQSLGRSLHRVGLCHSAQRRYDKALHWFQRAVAEKKQGDVFGSVDQESLRVSLKARGEMLKRLGQPNDE